MATRNMQPTGPFQIKIVNGNTKFSPPRHSVGLWRHVLVSPVEYKMRGYNTSTGLYEYWQTNNPSARAPSGVALSNTSIAAVLVNAFPTNE